MQYSPGARGWKNVGCTTLQAAVLLWFNVQERCTVMHLADLLGLASDITTVKSLIGSMCSVPQLRILKKTPRSNRIDLDDVLEIDSDFKSPKRVRSRVSCVSYVCPGCFNC